MKGNIVNEDIAVKCRNFSVAVKYSIKSSFLILLGSLFFALGFALLAGFILSGPMLGLHYDFLLNRFIKPTVSKEILIINTNEFVENMDIYSALVTLTEINASDLIFAGRVSPSASPVIVTEFEIRRRFIDEYAILGSNIRSLFDAIRSGSVTPMQAPVFVERLVELSEQGRDRLLSSLIEKDEDWLRSAAVFGSYYDVDVKPLFDMDGKIRRVELLHGELQTEHPVYAGIKERYADMQIETIDSKKVLWIKKIDGNEIDILLDKNSKLITPWNCDFRNIDISLFREYDEADRRMRRALTQAQELGAFSLTLPEHSPYFLGEYSLSLKEALLKSPDSEKRDEWVKLREDYFKSLDIFLNGSAQDDLINGYDEVIMDEDSLSDEGIAALKWMREEMISSFNFMKDEYSALMEIRNKLQQELPLSFCILGYDSNAQYCALLANALITGSHIKPVNDYYSFLFSAAVVLIILLIIFLMQPVSSLITGSVLSILAGAVISAVFIFYSWWIDPLIAVSSSLAGTFAVYFCKRAVFKYRTRRFRIAYGTAVSKEELKKIICAGKPGLQDVITASAAVVAIKDANLLRREDHEKPGEAGSLKKVFYTSVKDAVNSAGAVIAGYEGDTILACFGSPLDNQLNPVYRACSFVKELLSLENINWRFGIDSGDCTFCWSMETGYSVNGRPAVRAKVLASKTIRLKARALITDIVKNRINADAKKIDSLFDYSESIYDFSLSSHV